MTAPPPSWGPARRILVVDDHPIVRQGLRNVIVAEPDLEVVGEAADSSEALRALRTLRPDAAIIDISLRGSDGLELTKAVRSEQPDVPILVMSMHDESLYAERAVRAGASGYLMKQAVAENVVDALRLILEGGMYLSDEMQLRMAGTSLEKGSAAPRRSGVASLTDRELEVFSLIGRGVSTRRIAEDLKLSVKTVETHRSHIKVKLQVDTAPELVRRAVQWVENEQDATPGGR